MGFGDADFEARLLRRVERIEAIRKKTKATSDGGKPVAAKPVARRTMTSQEFKQRVDELVSDGWDFREAIRELSESLGLSSNAQQPVRRFQSGRDYFHR
jgi:ATPase subunit of ABC transporter with duplicated ATPase domains